MNGKPMAVILAAGVGKRFWPLTTYKYWVPFLGAPLLTHNLELVKQTGITDVVVVTTVDNKENIQSLKVNGLHIRVAIQDKPSGMADALLSAKELIDDRPMLVMNAADVVDSSLYKYVAKKIPESVPFVVGKTVDHYQDVGYIKLKGKILEAIIEKPGEGNQPSDMAYLVFDYFPDSSAFLSVLAGVHSDRDDQFEVALSKYAQESNVEVLRYDGFWQPIKYPWHILPMIERFLSTVKETYQGKNVEIKSNVVIEGPVILEDNVVVSEFTKIVGPCYIGPNTIIGNNTLIRQSHIGSGCMVGFNSDITRSYIGNACWFHSNYIGDSVLGDNVSFGAGTVTANVRLDEGHIKSVIKSAKQTTGRKKLGSIIGNNVRVGSNTTIMPGVKIGSASFVGAGVLLTHDVGDSSFCAVNQDITTTENTMKTATRDEIRKALK